MKLSISEKDVEKPVSDLYFSAMTIDKYFFIALLIGCGISILGCASFDKQDLYGHWKNDTWAFEFRDDGSCSVSYHGTSQGDQLKYTTLGNTLEISRDGHVIISNLTIKSLEQDRLTLQFRNLVGSGDQMDQLQILVRQ